MSYTIEPITELGIIQCIYTGKVTGKDFRDSAAEALMLAKQNNTKLFLIDESKWEGGTSTLDLHELPSVFETLGFNRSSRGALILPQSGTEQLMDSRFFATVCSLKGWTIKLFTDRQEGINWLNERG